MQKKRIKDNIKEALHKVNKIQKGDMLSDLKLNKSISPLKLRFQKETSLSKISKSFRPRGK